MIRWTFAHLVRQRTDVARAREFWAAATGTRPSVRHGRDWAHTTLLPAGGDACLGLLAADDAGSCPELPGVRLELADDKPDGLAVLARSLGARVGPDGWLRSPAGQRFTVRGWRGERTPPPGAVRLHRVVLEVPTGELAAELGFWSSLTGWDALIAGGGRDHRLLAPSPLPFDLSVRAPGPGTRTPAARPALVCDQPAATAALHRRLGARVGTASCADPTGAPYYLGAAPVR